MSFLKQNAKKSGYRRLYDQFKAELRKDHPEPVKTDGKKKWTDGHVHSLALRKMIKIFIINLYIRWREIEGLPVTEPYISKIEPQHNIIKPFTDK